MPSSSVGSERIEAYSASVEVVKTWDATRVRRIVMGMCIVGAVVAVAQREALVAGVCATGAVAMLFLPPKSRT